MMIYTDLQISSLLTPDQHQRVIPDTSMWGTAAVYVKTQMLQPVFTHLSIFHTWAKP